MTDKTRVLVIGDLILDKYNYGKATRLSPEAPIPVFEIHEVKNCAGGAANLACNLASLGLSVDLLGTFGTCENSLTLESILSTHEVNIVNNGRKSGFLNCKERFIDKSNHHQVGLRLDNDTLCIKSTVSLSNNFIGNEKYNAIVFSDYKKGSLNSSNIQDIIGVLKKLYPNTKMFLDTKNENPSLFVGIDYFKPNKKEFEFYKENFFECKKILLTDSENGMSFLDGSTLKQDCNVKAIDNNIVDPTGAGDVAMAAWIYSMTEINYETDISSLHFCNYMAHLSCKHSGTYVTTKEDTLKAANYVVNKAPWHLPSLK